MKKQLLLFAMILLPLVASAHDIEVQNADGVTIYYNYINNGTELKVTFRGSKYDSFSNEYQGNVAIPEEVTYMNRTRKVTSIGSEAFQYCSGLTSFTIGSGVKGMGYFAFTEADFSTVISLIENPFRIAGKTSGSRTFSQNKFLNATLYVPKGTIDKYKATDGWKDFVFIEEGTGGGDTEGLSRCVTNAVLIQSEGGSIKVQGVDEGTQVNVYGINGTQAGSAISQSGAATINTNLQPGSVAIVKIGQKSVKVVIK